MDKTCIINPGTGRAVKIDSRLGKKLSKVEKKEAAEKKGAAETITAAVKRAVVKKPEPPKPVKKAPVKKAPVRKPKKAPQNTFDVIDRPLTKEERDRFDEESDKRLKRIIKSRLEKVIDDA